MSKKKKEIRIEGLVVLLIVLLVLIYLLSFGNVNFLIESKQDRKLKLDEKRKLLENRFRRVQDVLDRKRVLKTKLDKLLKRVLFGVRLTLVLILLATIYLLYRVINFTLLELVEYFGAVTILFLLVGFVVIGSPTNFFTLWNYFEKKLILMIYGKYINIDKDIERHERELEKTVTDQIGINKEISELQAEIEIAKIIEE